MKVSVADLKDFTEKCLRSTGLGDDDSATAADALVTTDAMGVFTHGPNCSTGI
ncbi:MAG: hypothetical protein R3C19_13635 [Planctomycetaceae bacterium]